MAYKGYRVQQSDKIIENNQASGSFYNAVASITNRQLLDFYLVSGAPDASLGETGDYALDLVALKYYHRGVAGWDAGSNLGHLPTNSLKLTKPNT